MSRHQEKIRHLNCFPIHLHDSWLVFFVEQNRNLPTAVHILMSSRFKNDTRRYDSPDGLVFVTPHININRAHHQSDTHKKTTTSVTFERLLLEEMSQGLCSELFYYTGLKGQLLFEGRWPPNGEQCFDFGGWIFQKICKKCAILSKYFDVFWNICANIRLEFARSVTLLNLLSLINALIKMWFNSKQKQYL